MNKSRISYIPKSQSLESLHTQPTIETSIFSSTRDEEKSIKFSSNNDRRKEIIPTPHKPRNEQNLVIMNHKIGPLNQEQKTTLKDNRELNISTHIDPHCLIENASVVDKSNKQNHMCEVEDIIHEQKNENEIENQAQAEEAINDGSFDTFILQNFIRFSGRQNIVQWIDDTEKKFNHFSIGINLRFEAISLLVEGDAKRKYIKNRKEIRSCDDFYDFLLSEYESFASITCLSKSSQTISNQFDDLSMLHQTKSTTESNQFLSSNSNTLSSIGRSPIFSSTAVVNLGVTNTVGEKPAINSNTVSDSLSISISDQTQNDLRKAIVGNLIKNPKTFKGGKDDVNKWIEEIEHLLDLAHIPESTRLDLISYSLRGDALEWFKNSRSSFLSWSGFVLELKRAFTSSFHEELAFKKLESYSQGENQSIRSFFNDVLKLCKEADVTMSEATKLKNLVNKTKPSIQFEVRKKKPTSTTEFLEYAKEAEELMQLSNMTIDNSHSRTNTQVIPPQPISLLTATPSAPINQSFNNASKNYSSNYPRNWDNNYQISRNRNTYSNPNFSSSAYSKSFPNKSRFNNNFSRPYQQGYTNNFTSKDRKNWRPSLNNSSSNMYSRQSTANIIDLPNPSAETETLSETFSSIPCSRCNQLGHEASACPSF